MPNSDGLSNWESLPAYTNEAAFDKHCGELGIGFVPNEGRLSTRGVSLGIGWDAATENALVNVPNLLSKYIYAPKI